MSDFTASACTGGQLDARKRVNYALGLVLGEDEFRQEQYYLRERDHRAVRALHGYGTLAGLSVAVDADSGVVVRPGLAVDPAGRFMCVPSDQCASLGDWLTRNHDAVLDRITGSPALPGALPLYVVLCYRECETDKVPLPSEPCQSDEESMAASRITDGFELRLELDPPLPTNEVEGGLVAQEVDELVRLAQGPPSEGSPPELPGDLDDVRDRILDWILRRRPEIARRPCLTPGEPPCVLLARLDVAVDLGDDGSLALSGRTTVDDDDRPLLLSTRFLQEWLMALTAIEREEVRLLDDLDDVDTAGQAEGEVLTLEGDLWVPRALPPPPDHGDLSGLADDDHLQYVPADGTRPLTGGLDAGSNRLTQLRDAVDPQDAVTLKQLGGVIRAGDQAGGDLGGPYPNPTVVGLQGRRLSDARPGPGSTLVWNQEEKVWEPGRVEGGARPLRILPLATITPLLEFRYEIWFNLEAPDNPVEVVELLSGRQNRNLIIFAETQRRRSFLVQVPWEVEETAFRNLFVVRLTRERPDAERGCLRFTFDLTRLAVQPSADERGQSLADYAADNGIAYEGAGHDDQTVTRFVRDASLDRQPE